MKSGWVRSLCGGDLHFTKERGLRSPRVVCDLRRILEADRRERAGRRCAKCVAWLDEQRRTKETA